MLTLLDIVRGKHLSAHARQNPRLDELHRGDVIIWQDVHHVVVHVDVIGYDNRVAVTLVKCQEPQRHPNGRLFSPDEDTHRGRPLKDAWPFTTRPLGAGIRVRKVCRMGRGRNWTLPVHRDGRWVA